MNGINRRKFFAKYILGTAVGAALANLGFDEAAAYVDGDADTDVIMTASGWTKRCVEGCATGRNCGCCYTYAGGEECGSCTKTDGSRGIPKICVRCYWYQSGRRPVCITNSMRCCRKCIVC